MSLAQAKHFAVPEEEISTANHAETWKVHSLGRKGRRDGPFR